MDMDEGSQSLPPELHREVRLCKHGGDAFIEKSVKVLCNTILLRSVPDSMSSDNPMVCTEVVKLLGHILTTLVILKSTNLQVVLSHGISPVALEGKKSLTLGSERNGSLELGSVINEGNPVPEARMSLAAQRTMKVRVDKTKKSGSDSVGGGKGVGMHLA